MEYAELKGQIETMSPSQSKQYKHLLSLTSIAGDVWPKFSDHLAQAGDPDEFFEAIYEDDACRFENIWAAWARLNDRKWVARFNPEAVLHDVRLVGKGVFLESGDNEFLIPLKGRGQSFDIYLFPENGFNEKAGEFYASINGSFTCMGLLLEGTYDIYRANRAILFEQWEIDSLGRRANGKGQIRTDCDCSTVW